ncbi:hypothetical protein PHYSODRAFT_337210 [Phytophthora sojae]|uniref:Uncharacterized protein n=1 Tax=Phytophthora sojae (strain P6497) TaxID=1094619 RepID=G4ZZP0_PHYSP|nr:hypothetical protein PHYSODRAFT_337210 [Phytophthora sojae]EGZ10386.1 hypothetical protein PHYSODRAFT_337210 [Phytophthora sojae]|eukprot:XP_009533131.1 hypothetical protein PHYSODRAFT_337210 [Phytophthora sojae]
MASVSRADRPPQGRPELADQRKSAGPALRDHVGLATFVLGTPLVKSGHAGRDAQLRLMKFVPPTMFKLLAASHACLTTDSSTSDAAGIGSDDNYVSSTDDSASVGDSDKDNNDDNDVTDSNSASADAATLQSSAESASTSSDARNDAPASRPSARALRRLRKERDYPFRHSIGDLFDKPEHAETAKSLRSAFAFSIDRHFRFVKALRNLIPDAADHRARNLLHRLSELILVPLVDQSEHLCTYLDRKILEYSTGTPAPGPSAPARAASPYPMTPVDDGPPASSQEAAVPSLPSCAERSTAGFTGFAFVADRDPGSWDFVDALVSGVRLHRRPFTDVDGASTVVSGDLWSGGGLRLDSRRATAPPPAPSPERQRGPGQRHFGVDRDHTRGTAPLSLDGSSGPGPLAPVLHAGVSPSVAQSVGREIARAHLVGSGSSALSSSDQQLWQAFLAPPRGLASPAVGGAIHIATRDADKSALSTLLGLPPSQPPSTPPIAYVPLTAVDVRGLVADRSGAARIRDIEGIAHLAVRVPGFTAHELQTLAELLPPGDETAGDILVPSRLIGACDTMAPGSRGRAAEIQAEPLIDLFGPDHFGFRVLNTLRSRQFALGRVEDLTEVCRHQDADVSEDCLTCRNLNLALRRSQENRRKEGAQWRARVAKLRGDLRGEYNALVEKTRLILQAEHDDLRRAQEQLVLAEVDSSKARRDLAVLAAEQGNSSRMSRGSDARTLDSKQRNAIGDWEAFRDVVGAFERGQPVPCQLSVTVTRLDGGGSGAPFPEPSTPSTPSVPDRGLAQDRPAPGDEVPRPALGRLPRDQGPSRDDVTEDRQGHDVPGILVSIRGLGVDGSSASGARDHSADLPRLPGRRYQGLKAVVSREVRSGVTGGISSRDCYQVRERRQHSAVRDIEVVEIADDSDLDTDVGLDSSGTRMSSDGSRQVRPVGYAPETNRRSARYRAIDSDADPPRPDSEIQSLLSSGCALEDRDLQQSQDIVRGVRADIMLIHTMLRENVLIEVLRRLLCLGILDDVWWTRHVPEKYFVAAVVLANASRWEVDASRPWSAIPTERLDSPTPSNSESDASVTDERRHGGASRSRKRVLGSSGPGTGGQDMVPATPASKRGRSGAHRRETRPAQGNQEGQLARAREQALGSRDVEPPEPGAPSWIVYGVRVTRAKVRHGGLQSLGFADYQCLRGSLHLVQKRLLTGDYIGLLTVTSTQPLLPWDIMFQRRITVFCFFKQYSAMSSGLRSLVIEYVAHMREWRRAFWERTHWVENDRSDPAVSQLYADRRRRQHAWAGAWKTLRAQIEKLPEVERVLFEQEPGLWRRPHLICTWILMDKSADYPLAEQLELLDSREPARAYWSVPDSSARIAESVDVEVWSARVDNANERASRVIPVPPAMPPVS